MIGEHSWITFLCCQCRCQIFKGERYFRTVFYYNFQTVLVAIVCLKAETSHYGAARGFYRPSLGIMAFLGILMTTGSWHPP